jgi:hypothetical protein
MPNPQNKNCGRSIRHVANVHSLYNMRQEKEAAPTEGNRSRKGEFALRTRSKTPDGHDLV